MVAQTREALKTVLLYLEALRASGIPVSEAFLFGSFAVGGARDESDIDVAVISKAFTGDRFADRRRIIPLRRDIDSRIEPIPFRPEDFRRGGILVDEIKAHGVRVPTK